MNDSLVYSLILGSNLSFATATIAFTYFSKKVSPYWVNGIKAFIAGLAFLLTVLITGGFNYLAPMSIAMIFFSGFIGLCISDILLLKSFTIIGPGRTLVLFSFQPILFGIAGYFFLGQTLNPLKFLAIIFMIGCLFTFVLERKKETGKMDIYVFLMAFLGVICDAIGVVITRLVFEREANFTATEGCFYRCLGAFVGLLILRPLIGRLNLVEHLKKLSKKEKITIGLASLFGTYLSLMLYLTGLKFAHLASISALSITGPLFSSFLETIIHKKRPSQYLFVAFFLFICGMLILTFSS